MAVAGGVYIGRERVANDGGIGGRERRIGLVIFVERHVDLTIYQP